MKTTSSPSSTASEQISCADAREPVEHRLQHRTTWFDADRREASDSTCGVSENSLPSLATKPPRSSVNRMRRAVARGRSAALSEIAQRHRRVAPNIRNRRRPRSRLSTKSVARSSLSSRRLILGIVRSIRKIVSLQRCPRHVIIAIKFNRRTFVRYRSALESLAMMSQSRTT